MQSLPEEGLSVDRDREVFKRLTELLPGNGLTIIGFGSAQLGESLSNNLLKLRLLRLDLVGVLTASSAIDRILNDLADLAAARWPDWKEPSPELGSRSLAVWRRAATRLVSVGHRPRFRRLARETEFANLVSVLPSLALVADVDSVRPDRAGAIIAALDWSRRQGVAIVYMFSEAPAPVPPWDILLYEALFAAPPPLKPVTSRLILPSADLPRGSVIERRMREALRASPDLAGLFEDEIRLELSALGPTPRVDLLWRVGKVVIELDGPEHQRDPIFAADRHRDYELLVAGYLVLRLTNAEVELDLGRSLEKVRRVVNLRRGLS